MNTRHDRLVGAWLATHSSERTRTAYGRDVAAFVAWCDGAGVPPLATRPEHLDAYRDACLAAGASPSTVARRLSALASFFRHAAAVGAVLDNPAARVDRPPPTAGARSVLDDRELLLLVEAAEQVGSKSAALVALLALDGIKLNQVLDINIPRVHLAASPNASRGPSWIDVERHGQRQRVPISTQSAELVAAHIAARRRGPLFLGESPVGEPTRLTRFGADFLIKRAGAMAEIGKTVSANVLRRSYIEAAHRAGAPLEHIAQQVGHREARETARLLEESAEP